MIPRCSTTNLPTPATTSTPWLNSRLNPLSNNLERRWLAQGGALTVSLRKLGELQLRVMRESIVMPSPDERCAIHVFTRQPVYVREICMSVAGNDCVVARSVVSMQARRGCWQAINQLGRRPLADILYDDRRVARSVFQSAKLRIPHPLARLALRADAQSTAHYPKTLWARRSVFWRGGHPLLVAECFLPAFWQMACAHRGSTG